MDRKSEELPYHLEKLNDNNRLQRCLSDWPMFNELYVEDRKLQLMAYWRGAGGYAKAAELTIQSLEKYLMVGV